jgi:hypothetical protein
MALSEKIGNRLGFFMALMIFSSIMHYLASKFGILHVEYAYFIGAIVVLHVAYSSVKLVVK